LDKQQADDHPGFKVRVADTIGAGDAFTAGLIHEYLREAPIKKINDLANRMGAWASTQTGAMAMPSQDIRSILGKF
jgi:fructokinase